MDNNSQNELKGAIIKTIAFFDMFDCPLTVMEAWKFLGVKCELSEAQNVLEEIAAAGVIGRKNGYYCLPGREEIYETRMRRYNYANRKFKRAVRMARLFKILPWIRMIAVGNMMGVNNLRDDSDIDLFIITKKRRVWLTRLFAVGLTALLGLRPSKKNNKDKICLSFFVSEEGMELKGLMLPANDVYFKYWLANLVPIYYVGGAYENLIEQNNWLKEALPNWFSYKSGERRDAGRGFSEFYHDVIDMLVGGLEPYLMKWQIKRLPANLRELLNKDTRVVANERVIKLHDKDRRGEYAEKHAKRISELGT
jgi:hypothetical protein